MADAPTLTSSRSTKVKAAREPRFWFWLGAPGIIFLLLVYLIPVVKLMSASVLSPSLGLQNFHTLFTTPGYLQISGQTIWISVLSTLLAFLFGYPIAYLIATSQSRSLRRGLMVAVVASQLTSVLSRTFAWQVILGAEGPIAQITAAGLPPGTGSLLFTQLATTIGLVQFLLPFMILPLVTIMQRVDRSTVASASSLGAGPAVGFLRIFVPMTVAGIGVGTVLVFVYAVGSYATPAILGGRSGVMLGVVIEAALNQLGDNGLAAALALFLLLSVAVVVLLYRAVLAGQVEWLLNPEVSTASSSTDEPGPLRRGLNAVLALPSALFRGAANVLDRTGASGWKWPHGLLAAFVVIFLVVPQLITVAVSFSGTRSLVFPPTSWSLEWYRNFFTDDWLIPTYTSIIVGLLAAALATFIAGMAAISVARSDSSAMRIVLTVGMLLPLVVPGVVTAAAYYVFFLPLGLTDTRTGLVLAHTSLLLPFAFGIILANLQALSRNPEFAAANLGASPRVVVLRILLPQIRSGLIVAFLLGFLVSFDEAVVGIFLSGINVQTLPAHMFDAIQKESDPTIGVIGTLMMLVAGIAFLISLFKRKVSADTEDAP